MVNIMPYSARRLATAVALAASVGIGTGAYADDDDEKVATPAGFDKLAVYMGTGIFDPLNPEPRPGITDCVGIFCDGMFFQKDVMGRSDEEIAALRVEAKAFYLERFGIDVDDPALAGRISFTMFTLNPDFEYRLHVLSGANAPSEGWQIRDGGFQLAVTDPDGIDLGGVLDGTHAPEGSAMFFGNYNILVTDEDGEPEDELIVFYKSNVPGETLPNGAFTFRCDMFNEKWGEGLGVGTILTVPLEDGTVRANGRNILTFPPASALVEFPDFPPIGAHPSADDDYDDDDHYDRRGHRRSHHDYDRPRRRGHDD